MPKKPDVNAFGSGFASGVKLDENFTNIRNSFNNTLSLDGSTPNSMEADLDMNSNDIINVAGLSVSSLSLGGVNVTATDSLSSSKLTVKQEYNSVATMLADTTVHAELDILRVNTVRGYYQVAASGVTDHHLTNAGGSKLYYKPTYGVPISATGAVGGTTTYPGSDQNASINLAHTIAEEANTFVDYEGLKWRSEGTIYRKDVSIFSSGAQVLFPSTGTYDYFRLDDDSGDANSLDATRIAFDVSGSAFTILGDLSLYGVSGLSSFTTADRATVEEDLCAIAGRTGSVGEMTICGQLLCEGFGYWIYVPDNDTNFGTRQFARFTGQVRSRFNLTPCGFFGNSANGFDDSNLDLRIDRCGGYGSVVESKINGTELNFGYLFATGLTDKTGSDDWEGTTVSVTSGDATITLSGAGSSVLAAGDYIVILDAYTRSTDSRAIPLVARIASKTSATEFELEAETLPNLTDTGLNWFYRPPRISLSNAHLTAHTAYVEGFWDCIELEDNAVVNFNDLKGGGVRLSGRHQGILNTTGINNVIKAGVHRTMVLSNGLESVVSYGMIRVTADSEDAPLYLRLVYPMQQDSSVIEVLPAKGVDPVQFFQTGRTSRFGTAITRINAVVDYTNKETRCYFTDAGLLQTRTEVDGLTYQKAIVLDPAASIGSISKPVAMTTSPATVYDSGDLATNATYKIVASIGTGAWSEEGLFTTNGSGTVAVDTAGGTNITFSGSTTNLQAALAAGSSSVSFSLQRKR